MFSSYKTLGSFSCSFFVNLYRQTEQQQQMEKFYKIHCIFHQVLASCNNMRKIKLYYLRLCSYMKTLKKVIWTKCWNIFLKIVNKKTKLKVATMMMTTMLIIAILVMTNTEVRMTIGGTGRRRRVRRAAFKMLKEWKPKPQIEVTAFEQEREKINSQSLPKHRKYRQ